MLRERNPDSETFVQTVQYEVYLKDRDDPLSLNGTFEMRKDALDEGKELEDFMQIVLQHLLGTIDVVREHRVIMSDVNWNKVLILTDQIQAVSILAPSEETILGAVDRL